MKSQNHKSFLTGAALVIVSLACALGTPAPTAAPTLLPPTSTLLPPPPTQTPFPWSQVDLDSVLIAAGDMPGGLLGTFMQKGTPPGDMFDGLPISENTATRYFEKAQSSAFAVVFLYPDETNIQMAYDKFLDKLGSDAKELSDIGNEASSVVTEGDFKFADLVFIRCHSVVFIRITGYADKDDIEVYAKNLDAMLAEVVCP